MGERQPRATPAIVCKKCRAPIPVEVAVIRMGGAQLFVCPQCDHLEVWRRADEAPIRLPR